jgi:hypothetical protein
MLYVTNLQKSIIKIRILFIVSMPVFDSDRLLLSCIVQDCEIVLQIVLGSVGYKFRRKTPCPVLVMFLCRGWLSCGNLVGAVEEMPNV